MEKKKVPTNKFVAIIVLSIALVLVPRLTVYAQWEQVTPPVVSSQWRLLDVYMTSSNEGWAVGIDFPNAKGVLLHYSGGTWTSVTPPFIGDPWAVGSVHFLSANEGWAVGSTGVFIDGQGLVLHYSNGTWSSEVLTLSKASDWSLFDIHMTSSNEGWAVGFIYDHERGLFHQYSGSTWSGFMTSEKWYLFDIHMTSSNKGWAVGHNTLGQGVIFRYDFVDWTKVTPPTVSSSWGLEGVHFSSPNEGWAVGHDSENQEGVLLHYSGSTWTKVSPPVVSSYWSLSKVHFTSPNEGWAVGWDSENTKGVLLHYSNHTWTNVIPPNISSDWSLRSVFFNSPNDGWAVGWDNVNDNGVLLHYSITSPAGADLTGEWTSFERKCKETKKGTKCKLKGRLSVMNSGSQDAASSFVNFYLSDDEFYDEGDTYLKQVATGKVKPGKPKKKKLSYKMPLNEVATGKYVLAVIDADHGIEESDENNNTVFHGPLPPYY